MSFKISVSGIKTSMKKTFRLYSGLGWKSFFVKIRFWDAPYIEVEKLIPKEGKILDLGCGEGIFTNFLGLASDKRKILGIEIDKKRLRIANRGVKNVTFAWGDATTVTIPKANAIVLFHLLHHLNSYKDQEKVIEMCFNQLKKNGKLVIIEAEPEFSIKYLITWLTDHFIVPWLFERRFYSPIFFRHRREWKKVLARMGFSCRINRADAGHPFTHIILECKKINT